MTNSGQTLRIGVLGAANISGKALYDAAADVEGVVVGAIAARDRARAEAHAEQHEIEHVFDSYDALLASDEIDAVYNPLPINLHRDLTIAALDAGKHVLCEKPFASNTSEAVDMVEAGRRTGLVLVEAFHWRYHPFAALIRERIGEIGAIQSISADFSVPIPPEDDVRHAYELSGGALMDLGCYCVQWVRFAADAEPTVLGATMTEGRKDVDITTRIELEFPGGIAGVVTTDMSPGAERSAYLEVVGANGTVRVVNPIAPQAGHQLTVERDVVVSDPEQVTRRPTYSFQLEAFRDAVLHGRPVPTGGADSIATMAVIDAAYLAAGLPLRGQAD